MELLVVKERLHHYIEHADEDKLNAIYTLLEDEIETSSYAYDENTILMLEERRNEYLTGKVTGLSANESLEYIANEIKKHAI